MEPTQKQQFIDNLYIKLQEVYDYYWDQYVTGKQWADRISAISKSNAVAEIQLILHALSVQQEPEKITLDWIYSKWDEHYFTEEEPEIRFPEFTVIFPQVYYTHREEFGFYTALRVISNDDEVLMECDDMKVFERDYPKLAERVYARISNFDDASLRFAEVI